MTDVQSSGVNARLGQKKAAVRLTAAGMLRLTVSVKQPVLSVIQQLWDNIGRILGKFTSFYCLDGG